MAMDYGGCGIDMGQAAIQAAQSTRSQLSSLGISAKVGVTPMIGTNDVVCEVFSTSDDPALGPLAGRALDVFREMGLTSATVYTGLDEGHAPARAQYEKAGFHVTVPHVRYFLEL